METQFSDDMNTIRADDMDTIRADEMEEYSFIASEERRYKEEKAEFHGELESPEDIAEYESWLDGNALESV